MMKKEQLEEIKLLIEELTYEYVYDDTFYGLFVDIDRESIDLLIEQAEIGVNADKDKQTLIKSNIELNARVQQLEMENKSLNHILGEHIVACEQMEKKIKRYREALQHIRDNSNDKVAVFIADRALEESK